MKNTYNQRKNHPYYSFLSLGVFVAGMIFTGCVSTKKFTEAQNQLDQVQADLTECRQKSSDMQSEINTLRNRVDEANQLETENRSLSSQLEAAKNEIDQLKQKEPECPEAMTEGVYFKVQIGAFKERDISQELDTSVNIDIEDKGGMQEVVVGQFRDYYEADALQNHLRAMGVSDAWIVPYRDGQRVALNEVLEEVMGETQEQ